MRLTIFSNQRMWDLIRHQRSELHVAGLITDDEYAELAKDHSAVARLEDYDEVKADSERELARILKQKELDVTKHFGAGWKDGCICEPCIEVRRIVAEARLDEAKWWHGIAVTNNSLFVRDKSNAGVFSLGPDMTAAMKERLAAAEARVAEACRGTLEINAGSSGVFQRNA